MNRHIAFPLLLLGSLQLLASPIHQELIVHFGKDVSTLNEQAIDALDHFLASVTVQGDYHFAVEGHTDSDGSNVYNDTLAAARAKTVRQYLLLHGAEPKLVGITYRGERKPVASNAGEEGMSLNRRVRITFTRNVFADMDELRQALREGSVQHFTVDPSRDTLLKGKAGSTVAFTASAFLDADGRPVSAPVTIELTEALGALEMVAFGLSTRSDGRPLETDGMVQVQAADPVGNPLRLRSDAPMTVTMPTAAIKPRMQLFLSSTGTNWAVAVPELRIGKPVQEGWNQIPPRPPEIPFKLPVYKEDQRGKPIRPVQPVPPRVPSMHKEREYVRKDPWWGFMRPNAIRANTQKAYAQAEARYAASSKRYQARMERYNLENAGFPAAARQYEVRMMLWEERKKQDKERWSSEVYEPARERIERYAAPVARKYQAELAAWKKERNIALEHYAKWADSTRSTTVTSLTNYVFSTTELGWLNCDRFYSIAKESLQQVTAQMDQPGEAQVYLVFTSMRMLMNMEPDNKGGCISPLAPVDQPAVVFAFKVIGGRTQLCVQPVKPNEKPVLKFTPSSVAEVSRKLAELAGT